MAQVHKKFSVFSTSVTFGLHYLLLWHILSTGLLLIAIMLCDSAIGSTDDSTFSEFGNEIAQNGLTQDFASEVSNTTDNMPGGNKSEEFKEFEAANCTLNQAEVCGDDSECKDLNTFCIECNFTYSCPYGSKQKAMCSPKPSVNCSGARQFEKEYECKYCYQLPAWASYCSPTTDCALNKPQNYYPARPHYISTCWVKPGHLCLGRRCFHKQLPCNWSKGYKWSTAMLLSIFLGGFGVDRFYLGLWQDGIGKLLSFGGLGVWTLVDVILIGVGYIGPWDGSLYI